ncbi:MAG TPA: polysaccharide deacetylase family protein [Actinocrinis sp.]|nr:polysaccharide deacetylase family protein [Actinocrinis sp.]
MNYKPFVLMYHAVSHATDRVADPFLICVSPATLDRQFAFLTRRGLRGVSMRELLAAPDPSRLVGLTFDDGYADFHTEALPVLRRHGFTASVYVVVDRIGAVNDWEESGPVRKVMDLEQVRACAAAGMEVGSHGSVHAHLAGADPQLLAAEVLHSKEKLAGLIGQPVDGYCYAYGELDSAAVAAVREAGYDYGCAIWRSAETSRYALPRSYIGERDGALRLQAKRYRFKYRGGPVSLVAAPARPAARPQPVVDAPAEQTSAIAEAP